MPVRPEELSRQSDEPILEDRACAGCGYNLRGLRTGGKCPECGKPVKQPREAARYGEQMIAAPLRWLVMFRRGTFLLFAGGWALVLGVLGWATTFSPAALVAALIGSVAWCVGTVLATRPRPTSKARAFDPVQEWRVLRLWSRVSQPAWIAGLASLLVVQVAGLQDGRAGMMVLGFSGVAILVGIIGWWPLMVIQSNLAYWGADTGLSQRLRIISWSVGIALSVASMVLIGGRAVYDAAVGNSALGPLLFIIGALAIVLWAGFILVTVGYILLSLWQLWRMACWAVVSNMTVQMRDDRLRERAMRARPSAAQQPTRSGR